MEQNEYKHKKRKKMENNYRICRNMSTSLFKQRLALSGDYINVSLVMHLAFQATTRTIRRLH